ncbi:hypothetical protein [Streptomyces millisiae]|uniref:Uncharacterized protein n=1 Tax=Streptomyces millisiae TaxID=3075542 RepID=A0ABU2LHV6_9ACTN|nr:hypothetical protein [Streptomyces sp. DSM 44918]MDT0317101.1 hypothetical protein [Streptomyces sp. DSM 44918]
MGDTHVYSGTAIGDGRSVGRGGGSCQVIHVAGEDLTMQSLWSGGTSSLDMAITGGTGVYRNARGTARSWDIATPNERLRAEILR